MPTNRQIRIGRIGPSDFSVEMMQAIQDLAKRSGAFEIDEFEFGENPFVEKLSVYVAIDVTSEGGTQASYTFSNRYPIEQNLANFEEFLEENSSYRRSQAHQPLPLRELTDLIENLKDGQYGFQVAAQNVTDSSLKTLFSKYSAQRAAYVQELQSVDPVLREKSTESGQSVGVLHRGWINLKQALAPVKDSVLIDEAEAGEDAVRKAYEEAIRKDLPASVADLLRRQHEAVQNAHREIQNLKHSRQRAT